MNQDPFDLDEPSIEDIFEDCSEDEFNEAMSQAFGDPAEDALMVEDFQPVDLQSALGAQSHLQKLILNFQNQSQIDKHGWIQLYSGAKFFPAAPDSNLICIDDIAHSLSNMCRFSGHCRSFYSVAQHSVLVSHMVGPEYALWGLLHDASEAYLVDMPRPVKRLNEMKPFRDMESRIMDAVCSAFNLSMPEPSIVKQADTRMLATEARDLMSPLHPDWVQPCEPYPFKIEPLPPFQAKNLFLSRYRELVGDK